MIGTDSDSIRFLLTSDAVFHKQGVQYGFTDPISHAWLTEAEWLIYIGNLTINGSDNGSSPGRRPAIIRTNAGVLLIGPLVTNVIEMLSGIQTFSLKKMHMKKSPVKWWTFCDSFTMR